MQKNIPYHLIVAYLEGISNSEEEKALKAWLLEDEENKAIFSDCKKIWPIGNEAVIHYYEKNNGLLSKSKSLLTRIAQLPLTYGLLVLIIVILGSIFMFNLFK